MPKKRNTQSLKLSPRLHIFCEGEKTEPIYLTRYIERQYPGTTLVPIHKTPKNTPIQLVEVAIKSKQDDHNPDDDIFWVVYDREAKNKYPDRLHAEAHVTAKSHGIHIALSNVCFEVWILLHFQKTVAPYTSYTNLKQKSKLRTYIRNYDKAKIPCFSGDKIDTARKNAKILNKQTINGADSTWKSPHQWNPYTNVYELLNAIDAFGAHYIDTQQ